MRSQSLEKAQHFHWPLPSAAKSVYSLKAVQFSAEAERRTPSVQLASTYFLFQLTTSCFTTQPGLKMHLSTRV
jgi:hypothetical protein